jgi:hypothetical protein
MSPAILLHPSIEIVPQGMTKVIIASPNKSFAMLDDGGQIKRKLIERLQSKLSTKSSSISEQKVPSSDLDQLLLSRGLTLEPVLNCVGDSFLTTLDYVLPRRAEPAVEQNSSVLPDGFDWFIFGDKYVALRGETVLEAFLRTHLIELSKLVRSEFESIMAYRSLLIYVVGEDDDLETSTIRNLASDRSFVNTGILFVRTTHQSISIGPLFIKGDTACLWCNNFPDDSTLTRNSLLSKNEALAGTLILPYIISHLMGFPPHDFCSRQLTIDVGSIGSNWTSFFRRSDCNVCAPKKGHQYVRATYSGAYRLPQSLTKE